jgi:hypothetical protein
MGVTIFSFLIYAIVIDLISFPVFSGMILLPNLIWLLLIFGLAPCVALASIGLTVIISMKAEGSREAQQISVILLLPILGLILGQTSGAIILGPAMLLLMIAIFLGLDFVIFRIGVKVFRREEILSKL